MIAGNNVVYLVSCVSGKGSVPTSAKDLYTSSWFKKARCYVEQKGCRWFILSAEHGLVAPDQVIAPYEKTLRKMPIAGRKRWSQMVSEQLQEASPHMERAIFLAGLRYREFLMRHLRERNVAIEIPMEGLKIGEQLRWLGNRDG